MAQLPSLNVGLPREILAHVLHRTLSCVDGFVADPQHYPNLPFPMAWVRHHDRSGDASSARTTAKAAPSR